MFFTRFNSLPNLEFVFYGEPAKMKWYEIDYAYLLLSSMENYKKGNRLSFPAVNNNASLSLVLWLGVEVVITGRPTGNLDKRTQAK